MSDNNIKLLTVWYYKSKLYYNCHRDSSDYYELLHKMLGLPAILINVFNTTSLFSNYNQINELFILIIAILSLVSTMLTACQNYFEFNKLKNDHIKLMIQYSKVLYCIEKILIKNDESDITEDKMNNILNLFEKLREDYIFFPEKIWKNNNLIYLSKLNSLNVNTTDSINIILSSIKRNKNFLFDDETSKDYNESKNSEIITYSNKIQENTTKSIEQSKDNNDIDKIQYLV